MKHYSASTGPPGSRRRPVPALLAVLLAAGHLAAGSDRGNGFSPLVQRARTVLVQVDVRVEDADGAPVPGLTAADFLLHVDGRYAPIVSFEEIAGAARRPDRAAQPAPDEEPEGPSATFVFFFDNVFSNHFERQRAARAADRMLHDVLRRGDRFTAVALGQRFKVIRPLSRADERSPTSFATLLADPEVLDTYADDREARVAEVRELLEMDPSNPERARVVARAYATEEGNRAHAVLEALRALLTALEPIRERKHLMVFSAGVAQRPGAQYLEAVGLEDEIFGMTRTTGFALERLFREANSARTSIFPVDLAGLEPTAEADRLTGAKDGLISLALNTGGKAVLNTNDPGAALDRAVSRSRDYYLLGFAPETSGDGKYHRIEVRVRNRAWRVQGRGGFLDFTAAEASERQVMGSFVLPEMFREIPATLELVPLERRGKDWMAALQLRMPLERVERLPQGAGSVGQLEMGGTMFRGAVAVSRFDRGVTLRFPPSAAPAGELVLQEIVRVGGGTYRGTAVVRDVVSGRMGGCRLETELAGRRPAELVVVLGKRLGDDRLVPPPAGALPSRPASLVAGHRDVIWKPPGSRFEHRDTLVAAYLLPGRNLDEPPFHALEKDGERVRTSRPTLLEADPKGRYRVAYEELPLADLAIGTYRLEVRRDAASGEADAETWFRVGGPAEGALPPF